MNNDSHVICQWFIVLFGFMIKRKRREVSLCFKNSVLHIQKSVSAASRRTKPLLFSKCSQTSSVYDRALLLLDSVMIEYIRSYKCLRFTLDEHLDYSDHMKDLCRKLNYGMSIISRVREYLPRESLANLANSLVQRHLNYCSPLFHNFSLNI